MQHYFARPSQILPARLPRSETSVSAQARVNALASYVFDGHEGLTRQFMEGRDYLLMETPSRLITTIRGMSDVEDRLLTKMGYDLI